MRVLALLVLAACSIPDTQFTPSTDAPPGSDGDMTATVQIVASNTNVTVTEGAGATNAFAVHLSQMPDHAVTVNVGTMDSGDGTAVIAVQETQLQFEPQNYNVDQPVHVSGLVDADAVDDHENIVLSADGLTDVTITVKNQDVDTVAIQTDIPGTSINVNESGSVAVMVQLTHQPQGDVTITAAATSPSVSIDNGVMQFSSTTWNQPQTFTIDGLEDANAMAEQVPLTLTPSTGSGIQAVSYTIDTIDNDALNILASPTSLSVPEGSSRDLMVSLTADPGQSTQVMLGTMTGSVTLSTSSITFTSATWSTPVPVHVTGVQDEDTQNNPDTITLSATGLTDITVGCTVIDDDVQQIFTDATNTVTVNENGSATFHATLKQMPTGNVTISLASDATGVATVSPGSLLFTPANYNDLSHTYTITGTHDPNLSPNSTTVRLSEASIGETDVAVTVNDIDMEGYVVSNDNVSVTEGQMATFTVKLAFDPGTTQSVTISDTNSMALPISPSSFTFTGGAGGTWNTPKTITVSPPIDTNNVAEMATFTITGVTGAPDHAVQATVVDPTVLHTFGAAAPPVLTGSETFDSNLAVAERVMVNASTTVDTLAMNVPAGVGDFTMALYADNGGTPGNLLVAMPVGVALSAGTNIGNVNDTVIAAGTYWIALRFDQNIPVSQSTTTMQNICIRNLAYNDINQSWGATFGASTCESDYLFNIWMNTYNQP
ncbi:MAG TPA: hypothetical protein VGM88_08245 [Kofleriaceae bacterium]|jgi:hypothetical protein